MPKKFENKSKSHSTKTGIVFNPSKIKTKIVDYGGKEETQRRLEQGRSTMARQREGRRMTTACSPQRQWKRPPTLSLPSKIYMSDLLASNDEIYFTPLSDEQIVVIFSGNP